MIRNHSHLKIQIYQRIVKYLVESTNYNLQTVAELTDSSINTIQSIYLGEQLPSHFPEHLLIRLYLFILEIQNTYGY